MDQGVGVGVAFANRLANCSIAKVLVGPDRRISLQFLQAAELANFDWAFEYSR